MRIEIRFAALAVCTASLFTGCSHTKCVTFDSTPVGTNFGLATGYGEGAAALTEDGIPVSVHDMGGDPNKHAEVLLENVDFGRENIIRPRNMNLEFDFTQLDFTPCKVTFKFLDWGGREYISVNSEAAHIGELTLAPTSWPGGISMTVTSTRTPRNPHNKTGKAVIEGPVQKLRVGGQEFFVDDVCAKNCGGL